MLHYTECNSASYNVPWLSPSLLTSSKSWYYLGFIADIDLTIHCLNFLCMNIILDYNNLSKTVHVL